MRTCGPFVEGVLEYRLTLPPVANFSSSALLFLFLALCCLSTAALSDCSFVAFFFEDFSFFRFVGVTDGNTGSRGFVLCGSKSCVLPLEIKGD